MSIESTAKKLYDKPYSSLNTRQQQQVRNAQESERQKQEVKKSSNKVPQTVQPIDTPVSSDSKSTIILGVERTPSGLIKSQENIGKDFSESERRQIVEFIDSGEGVARSRKVAGGGVEFTRDDKPSNKPVISSSSSSLVDNSLGSRVVGDFFSARDPVRNAQIKSTEETVSRDRFGLSSKIISSSDKFFSQADDSFRVAGDRLNVNDVEGFFSSSKKGFSDLTTATAGRVAGETVFLGELGASAVRGAGRVAGRLVSDPLGSARKTGDFFVQGFKTNVRLVTDKPFRQKTFGEVKKAGKEVSGIVATDFLRNPTGATASLFVGTGLAKAGSKISTTVKNVKISLLYKEIPADKVFSPKVLSGSERFPTTTGGTDNVVKAFSDKDFAFVTASPQKISGGESKLVGRGLSGTEAGGISVAPFGEGSPLFLGLKNEGLSSYSDLRFSFNPFSSPSPTATFGRAEGIIVSPKTVTSVPGFEAENVFMRSSVADSGFLLVPKRVQIGQGDVSPQFFNPIVRSSADDVPVFGRRVLEKGTTETEAKIVLGQSFIDEGVKGFVRVSDYNVPLRKISLVSDKSLSSFSNSKFSVLDKSSVKRLSSSSSLSSKTVTPVSFSGSSSIVSSSFSGVSGSSSFSVSSARSGFSSFSGVSGSSSTSKSFFPSSSSSLSSSLSSSSSSFSGGSSSSSSTSFIPSSSSTSFIPSSSSTSFIPDSDPERFGNIFFPKRKKGKKGLFFFEVLEKGVFKTKGKETTAEKAFQKGLNIVSNTINRTFRIKTASGQIITNINDPKLRKSKTRTGSFVERSKFAISTGTEKTTLKQARKKSRRSKQ